MDTTKTSHCEKRQKTDRPRGLHARPPLLSARATAQSPSTWDRLSLPWRSEFTQVEMFESPCLSQEGGQRSPGAPRAGEINHHILLCVSAPDPPSPQSRGQAERLLSNLDARWRQDPVQNATTKSGTRGPTEDFRSSSLLWLQPTQLQDGAGTRGRHVLIPPLRETPPPVQKQWRIICECWGTSGTSGVFQKLGPLLPFKFSHGRTWSQRRHTTQQRIKGILHLKADPTGLVGLGVI